MYNTLRRNVQSLQPIRAHDHCVHLFSVQFVCVCFVCLRHAQDSLALSPSSSPSSCSPSSSSSSSLPLLFICAEGKEHTRQIPELTLSSIHQAKQAFSCWNICRFSAFCYPISFHFNSSPRLRPPADLPPPPPLPQSRSGPGSLCPSSGCLPSCWR